MMVNGFQMISQENIHIKKMNLKQIIEENRVINNLNKMNREVSVMIIIRDMKILKEMIIIEVIIIKDIKSIIY